MKGDTSNNNMEEKKPKPLQLDYTITSPVQRNELVKKIIAETASEKLTPKYLQILANYIIFAMTKEEKKKKQITTDNRLVTINKRETSYEGLVTKFENGEDGVYNMIIQSDKNILLTPKISITEEDLKTIPPLRGLKKAIQDVKKLEKVASGKNKYLLKKQLIQMYQDQYVIKQAYRPIIYTLNMVKNFNNLQIDEKIEILDDQTIKDDSLISFMNPIHISALLCNYSKLKEQVYGKFYIDGYYLMEDLDILIQQTLKNNEPILYQILIYKIDGKSNLEIQSLIYQTFQVHYSLEYISSLWRKKIPKLLSKQAKKQYLEWYYTEKEKGKWKKCSRCKQIKLANNIFFSKNKTSSDGFYSICKDCRNKRTKEYKNSSSEIKIIKYIPYLKSVKKEDEKI